MSFEKQMTALYTLRAEQQQLDIELKAKLAENEWDRMDPYTGADYIEDSIRQQRELEAARREWERAFMADQKRLEEWL